MIDLLPTHGKKMAVREVRERFLAVFLLVMAGICLAAALLSLPTGVLLARYEATLEDSAGLADEVHKRKVDVERDLSDIKNLIEFLDKKTGSIGHASLISSLDQMAGEEVILTHFNFDGKKKLILSGVASTRSSLSAFRDRVSGQKDFKSVELPLSSLVKDTEVPFTMTLTLN